MILKGAIKKVESSKAFKDFKSSNPEYYLAHCFTMLDEAEKKYNWELGYYSPKKDKLVVFETEPDVKLREEDDAFTRNKVIPELKFSKVKISMAKAMETCDQLVKEKYSAHMITKRIIILQHLDRDLYNITLVTRSFSVLNIKIDAASGEIVSHNLQSLMSLGKWEKGERNREPSDSNDHTVA